VVAASLARRRHSPARKRQRLIKSNFFSLALLIGVDRPPSKRLDARPVYFFAFGTCNALHGVPVGKKRACLRERGFARPQHRPRLMSPPCVLEMQDPAHEARLRNAEKGPTFGATLRARSVAIKVGFPDVHPMM
jgi:hypothetical protein